MQAGRLRYNNDRVWRWIGAERGLDNSASVLKTPRQRTMKSRLTSLLCLAVALTSATGFAQEWTRFRGPNGTGVGNAPDFPTTLTEENILWKASIEGSGHSSPVLWGDKLWLTSSIKEGQENLLLCFDATSGDELWRRSLSMRSFRIHQYNSFASPSPAADAERVYITWTTPEKNQIAAYTHEGELAWSHDLGPFESQHGGGVSPVVVDGKVILPNDQLGGSFLIAFDAASGDIAWRTERSAGSKTAYSTPCVYGEDSGNPYLVFNSSTHGITGVSIKSGEKLWEINDGLFDKRSCSSPTFVDGVIFGSCGSGGGGNYVVAVEPPTSPGGEPKLRYEVRRSAPYVPTNIVKDGFAYLWSDGGIVSRVEAMTGETTYRERAMGNYFASPILINDAIYNVSTDGQLVVIKASEDFEVLSRFDFDATTHATPAVAHGKMYLRTVDALYCLGTPGS